MLQLASNTMVQLLIMFSKNGLKYSGMGMLPNGVFTEGGGSGAGAVQTYRWQKMAVLERGVSRLEIL